MKKRPKNLSSEKAQKPTLFRMTKADKWVATTPKAILFVIFLTLIVLIPAMVHSHYYFDGRTFNGIGVPIYLGVAIFTVLLVICYLVLKGLSQDIENKWDEVERFIEYKSACYAGTNTVMISLAIWGFAMWFPKYYTIILTIIPVFCLYGYAVMYLTLRSKYRKQYEA